MGAASAQCWKCHCRNPDEPPDGRLVAGSSAARASAGSGDGEPPERVMEVVFEGRHGKPPVVLWYPESALESVQPPQKLIDAMEQLKLAEEELARKKSELQKAKECSSK